MPTLSLSELLVWPDGAAAPDATAIAAALRNIRPPTPAEQWLTVTQCAELLLNDVSGLDVKKAMARVSWAAGKNKFRANGRKGSDRRIERVSFDVWRLEQRVRDLDESESSADP